MRCLGFAAGVVCAMFLMPLWAGDLSDELLLQMGKSDVVILGEVHDNPAHHETQRSVLELLQPRAVVWEMLTPVEAGSISAALLRSPERLEKVLKWAESGWPAFSMYYPILAVASDARIYGGEVPRQAAMAVMKGGEAVAFGADAARYGLNIALPEEEAARRESLQFQAHCDAVPMDRMAAMVGIQRLRDATLAREVVRAIEDTGGPVAVITGNGHARKDWGIPAYLQRVRPDLQVFSLGQSENGQVEGPFDAVIDSAPPERDDPCAAFESPARQGG
jgi:uncharacterized iron-regulated protein